MATKSFLKSVNIKTAKQAERFINALEKAEQFHEQRQLENNLPLQLLFSDGKTGNELIKKNPRQKEGALQWRKF